MDSVFERPLTIDEVRMARAIYIEMRSSCFRIYRTDYAHIVRCVDDEAVHLICKYKPYFEIAEFDNYNIGWRAWLRLPTDEISSKYPWDEVKKCKGVGYGWDTTSYRYYLKGATTGITPGVLKSGSDKNDFY